MSDRKYEEPTEIKREKVTVKRKRKPMSDEQRAAAAERLAKARKAKGTPKNASLHETIRELPDDHYLSPKKVKEWIKVWTERLRGMKQYQMSKDRNERREYQIAEVYIRNMKSYLQSGIWSDHRYGEEREHKTRHLVVAEAYDKDGEMKRTKGFFYRDAGYWEEQDE